MREIIPLNRVERLKRTNGPINMWRKARLRLENVALSWSWWRVQLVILLLGIKLLEEKLQLKLGSGKQRLVSIWTTTVYFTLFWSFVIKIEAQGPTSIRYAQLNMHCNIDARLTLIEVKHKLSNAVLELHIPIYCRTNILCHKPGKSCLLPRFGRSCTSISGMGIQEPTKIKYIRILSYVETILSRNVTNKGYFCN